MVNIKIARRLVNGAKQQQQQRPRKRNSALISLGYLNPNTPNRKTTMTKTKAASGKKHKPRKPNPTPRASGPQRHKKQTKPYRKAPRFGNPTRSTRSKILSPATSILKSGLFAGSGFIAARQIPQLFLGARNSGWIGYLANGATAGLAGYAASKLGNRAIGTLVFVGGSLYVVARILTEQFSPAGKLLQLAGIGDATASATLGRIKEGYFPLPVVLDREGNPVIPKAIIDASRAEAMRVYQEQRPAPTAAAPAAAATVKGIGPRGIR